MLRTLPACAMAVALMVVSGVAQEKRERPLTGASAVLVGLPVFTSDGREIGKVIGTARDREPMLIAEIEGFLGMGPKTVVIPIDMFVQRADRIDLKITHEQVSDRLAGPEPSP
jgi:PRC-barrel domain